MIGIVDRMARATARARVDELGLDLPAGVEVRLSRWIPTIGGYLSGMRNPAAAVTLGRTILLHPSIVPGERLLRHEMAHVEQWMRHRFTFPFRYTAAHILYGYSANPFEREARAAERTGR